MNPPILPLFNEAPPYHGPAYNATIGPNIIVDDESIARVFCFGAFAEKVTGVVYNNCTGKFPYTALNGNVCFFVMYHYETNAILVTPISGLDSADILATYKNKFEYLVSKGFTPKLNVIKPQNS